MFGTRSPPGAFPISARLWRRRRAPPPLSSKCTRNKVAGLSGYGFLDDMFYLEFGGYRPLSTNIAAGPRGRYDGSKPDQWRCTLLAARIRTKFWKPLMGTRQIRARIKS